MRENLEKISCLLLVFVLLIFANAYAYTGKDNSSTWNNQDIFDVKKFEESISKSNEIQSKYLEKHNAYERQKIRNSPGINYTSQV